MWTRVNFEAQIPNYNTMFKKKKIEKLENMFRNWLRPKDQTSIVDAKSRELQLLNKRILVLIKAVNAWSWLIMWVIYFGCL